MQVVVLVSELAFYPIHWAAFKHVCVQYPVEGVIVSLGEARIPDVHKSLGTVNVEAEHAGGFSPAIFRMPRGNKYGQMVWLIRTLTRIRPNTIWWQGSPNDLRLMPVLLWWFFRRTPFICSALCENIFDPPMPSLMRRVKRLVVNLVRRVLWKRLNFMMAVAMASVDGIQRIGMPSSKPYETLVQGKIGPPKKVLPLALPFGGGASEFVVGFAGRICREKGWRVLLDALAILPNNVFLVVAGDGPEREDFIRRSHDAAFADRIVYLGLLPIDELWRFYKAVDCLVVPSMTTPHWKEQGCSVLMDAMSMGVPIVASDCGGVREVMGASGIMVRENNANDIVDAILFLRSHPKEREALICEGRARFSTYFDIPSYATSIARCLRLPSNTGGTLTARSLAPGVEA